tara:strand:+ start:295 stop:1011 length:717 start_codon:yes stop_codon:yes gene_type:complete
MPVFESHAMDATPELYVRTTSLNPNPNGRPEFFRTLVALKHTVCLCSLPVFLKQLEQKGHTPTKEGNGLWLNGEMIWDERNWVLDQDTARNFLQPELQMLKMHRLRRLGRSRMPQPRVSFMLLPDNSVSDKGCEPELAVIEYVHPRANDTNSSSGWRLSPCPTSYVEVKQDDGKWHRTDNQQMLRGTKTFRVGGNELCTEENNANRRYMEHCSQNRFGSSLPVQSGDTAASADATHVA